MQTAKTPAVTVELKSVNVEHDRGVRYGVGGNCKITRPVFHHEGRCSVGSASALWPGLRGRGEWCSDMVELCVVLVEAVLEPSFV